MFGTYRRRSRQGVAYHSIGLDLGFDAVKMLQLRTPADGVTEVAAAARVEIPSDPGLSAPLRQHFTLRAIRDAFRAAPFVGRAVNVALPREIVQLRTLRVAPAAGLDAITLAEREAAGSFPFALSSARVAYLPAGEVREAGETRHEVIAAAAADADVTAFLERMSRAGVQINSIDLEHAALYRAAERALAPDQVDGPAHKADARVVLDVGATATHLVIGRGGEPCVMKTVPVGTRQIEEVAARRLSVSVGDVRQLRLRNITADAFQGTADEPRDPVSQALHDAMRVATADLFEQVVLCIRYYTVSFRGRPPARVWVTGGGAEGADLCELARRALGLPVESLPLMAGLPLGPLVALDNTPPLGEWAVAYGLALRGVPTPEVASLPVEVARA